MNRNDKRRIEQIIKSLFNDYIIEFYGEKNCMNVRIIKFYGSSVNYLMLSFCKNHFAYSVMNLFEDIEELDTLLSIKVYQLVNILKKDFILSERMCEYLKRELKIIQDKLKK
jgi:F0F1-type ATP synthase alpha subunit